MTTSNNSTVTWGPTYALSTVPMSTGPMHENERPKEPPKALITTRAVQIQAGWVGQVIIDREIIWETAPMEDSEDAVQQANAYVIARVRRLFAPE